MATVVTRIEYRGCPFRPTDRNSFQMKPIFPLTRLLLLLPCLLLLTQCAPRLDRRIERNMDLFVQLSPEDQQLVRAGRIREGMTQEAVFLAMGRPDRVGFGRRAGKVYETWSYTGQRAITTHHMGMGMGWGGWGGRWGGWGGPWGMGPVWDPMFMGGPSVTYVPYEAGFVEFMEGRVTGWQVARR
jgi:hypothetical protein